jgi:hypothetical protein
MALPRIALGLALAVTVTAVAAAPAYAFDPNSPTCTIEASTASTVTLPSADSPIPIDTRVAYSCGQTLADGGWAFTWTSSTGRVVAWSPGRILYRPPTSIVYQPGTTPGAVALDPGVWTLACTAPAGCSVTSGPVTIVRPASTPPAAAPKDATAIRISGASRHHGRLTVAARLVDVDRSTTLHAVLRLQRKGADGWHTVAKVASGRFTVRTPEGTYRLAYSGSTRAAATVSRAFSR